MRHTVNPAYELIGRLNHEPFLIAPTYSGITATLRAMLDGEVSLAAVLADTAMRFGSDTLIEGRLYATVDRVAVIPVHGLLLNRFSGAWGFATGYDYIRNAYQMALRDPEIRGIAFDVNSHGGDAQGCFEACDAIRAGRSAKPSIALVNANACSAAYALASAAGTVVAAPSARVGSVGVVTMHLDLSKALDNAGLKVTFVFAGKHKIDGNPYEALPKAVKDAMQERVDALYSDFVALVAANRRLEEKAVRQTEAAVFDARQAAENGFVDRIEDVGSAFLSFLAELSPQNQEFQMTTKTETPKTPAASVPEAPEVPTESKPFAVDADAITAAERERIAAILGCDEAKGRATLAAHLAFNTSMSVDESKGLLVAAAVEAPTEVKSPFLAAMDESEHPEVGAGSDPTFEPEPNSAAAILRDYSAATGYKLKTVQ